MDKPQNTPNSTQPTLTKKDVRGLELGEESKIWKEVASSEARLTPRRRTAKKFQPVGLLPEIPRGIPFLARIRGAAR